MIDEKALEALAEAWASIDGHLDAYRRERDGNVADPSKYEGRYDGYQAEAAELIERLRARGFDVTPLSPDTTSEALDLIIELRADNAALRERLGEPEPEKPDIRALLARLGHGGRQ